MKKFFLMALSVFLFSTTASFAGNDDNSNKVANEIEVSIEKAAPTVWEGFAKDFNGNSLYIRVYYADNACSSLVAHVYANGSNSAKTGEVWVKENPNYNPKSASSKHSSKYYITYGNRNYYFDI